MTAPPRNTSLHAAVTNGCQYRDRRSPKRDPPRGGPPHSREHREIGQQERRHHTTVELAAPVPLEWSRAGLPPPPRLRRGLAEARPNSFAAKAERPAATGHPPVQAAGRPRGQFSPGSRAGRGRPSPHARLRSPDAFQDGDRPGPRPVQRMTEFLRARPDHDGRRAEREPAPSRSAERRGHWRARVATFPRLTPARRARAANARRVR